MTYDILNIYSLFSIFFHLILFLFLWWNHFIKIKTEIIPDKYLKLIGLIGIIMGLIFLFYGNKIVNNM